MMQSTVVPQYRRVCLTVAFAVVTILAFPKSRVIGETLLTSESFDPTELGQASRSDDSQGSRVRAKSEGESLVAAAARLRGGVVYLGVHSADYGTGFVISRNHRLVVTAGHVADKFYRNPSFRAFRDGCNYGYKVAHVWFHPLMERELDRGLWVRSDNSIDGKIRWDHDLAVVQLTGEGPELPFEFELAGDRDLRDLDKRLIGLLSYSGRQDYGWPATSQPAFARNAAVKLRPEKYSIFGDESHTEDLLVFSLDFPGGCSGSPLFLPTGHVVGLPVKGITPRPNSEVVKDDVAMIAIDRIDALLAYHNLTGLIRRPDSHSSPGSDWGPDARLNEYRNAVALRQCATRLRISGDYAGAVNYCNAALSIAPRYGAALHERSKSYLIYLGRFWDHLTYAQRCQYSLWAIEDSTHCLRLCPEWNDCCLFNVQIFLYVAALAGSHDVHDALDFINRILDEDRVEPLTDFELSFAVNLRAQCHVFLGEMDEARDDYDESIRLAPDQPRWYHNRAQFRRRIGHLDAAEEDSVTARRLEARR